MQNFEGKISWQSHTPMFGMPMYCVVINVNTVLMDIRHTMRRIQYTFIKGQGSQMMNLQSLTEEVH